MTKQIWIGIGVLAAALTAGTIGYQWLQEHDALTKAQAVSAAQQTVVAKAQTDAQVTAQQLDARLKVLETEKQQPATAPQIVIDAQKLPQQLQVVQPPPVEKQVDGKTVEIPSAPVVQIPQVDFQALQNGVITCQENDAKLTACNLTAADTQTELKAVTAERDQWKTAAKGGTLWRRVVTAGKWIVIGGVTGYVAGKAAK
jgi:hypothetical protein